LKYLFLVSSLPDFFAEAAELCGQNCPAFALLFAARIAYHKQATS